MDRNYLTQYQQFLVENFITELKITQAKLNTINGGQLAVDECMDIFKEIKSSISNAQAEIVHAEARR